jgi:hypothetical protein
MSRKPSFANLRSAEPTAMPAPPSSRIPAPSNDAPPSRQGRKQIAGFFSNDMSFAMRSTAMRRGISLQTAMAEAFNDWLRKNGESPVGE